MAETDEKKSKKPEPGKPGDEIAGKIYDSRLMRRLGHYLKPYWWQTCVSALSVSLKSLCDVAGPYLVMVAIDRYIAPAAKGGLAAGLMAHNLGTHNAFTRLLSPDPVLGVTQLAAVYLAALLAAYLFEFIQVYTMQWIGQKLMFDLRREIFRHMQRMHVGFFDAHPVGRLVTRLTSDVDAINDMFTAGVLAIIDDFFNLILMATLMVTINWWLALLAFAVLPLIFVVTRLFRDSVRESYRRVRAAIARINSFTQEHISGMAVVQMFNREERAFKDFEAVNRLHMIAFKDTIFAYALYYPAVEILSVAGHCPGHLAGRLRRPLSERSPSACWPCSSSTRSASGVPSRTSATSTTSCKPPWPPASASSSSSTPRRRSSAPRTPSPATTPTASNFATSGSPTKN